MSPFTCCVFPRQRQRQREQRHSSSSSSGSNSGSNNGPIRLIDRTTTTASPRQRRFPISTDSSTTGPKILTASASSPSSVVSTVDAATGLTPSMRRIFASASASASASALERGGRKNKKKRKTGGDGEGLSLGTFGGGDQKFDSASTVVVSLKKEEGGKEEKERGLGTRWGNESWIRRGGRIKSPQKLKVKKSVSRESNFRSGKSGKSGGIEEVSPRLNRKQDDDDWLDTLSIYESDAVALKTPRSTWGRQVEMQLLGKEPKLLQSNGTARLHPHSATAPPSPGEGSAIGNAGPRHLSRVLERSASTSQSFPPSHRYLERKDMESTDTGASSIAKSVEGVLAQMLTSRAGGSQVFGSHNSSNREVVPPARGQDRRESRQASSQRFIFEDVDAFTEEPEATSIPLPSPGKSSIGVKESSSPKRPSVGAKQPSSPKIPSISAKEQQRLPAPYPLERTDTVIHLPSTLKSAGESPSRFWTASPASLISQLLPQGLGSFSISSAHDDYDTSCPGKFPAEPQPPSSSDTHDEENVSSTESDSGANSFSEPVMEEWRRTSVSKTPGPDEGVAISQQQEQKQIGVDDPDVEEGEASEGADGKGKSSLSDERRGQGNTQSSSSSELSSVHLYKMRIPELLASSEIVPSLLLPHMSTASEDTGSAQGITLEMVSEKPRDRSSALSFPMATIPVVYASSSVYTRDSKYLDPADSNRSSVIYMPPRPPGQLIKGLTDTDSTGGAPRGSNEIISVRPSNGKTIDLDRLERRTQDTSFHSSKESLTNRELASAEARIVPLDRRAKTVRLPKSSWFKEDFDEVSREIEETNPRNSGLKRRSSWWDGAADQRDRPGSLRVMGDDSRSRRFSVVSGKSDEGTSSAWERALREHAREDRFLARTRLGSGVPSLKSRSSVSVGRTSHTGPISQLGESADEITVPDDAVVLDHHESRRHDEGPIDIRARLGAYRLPPRSRPRSLVTSTSPSGRPASRSRSSSPSAWARYPSHELATRSPASAGEADGVRTRDFALEHSCSPLSTPPPLPVSKFERAQAHIPQSPPRHRSPARFLLGQSTKQVGKSRSMTFGQNVAETLKGVYRMTGLELNRRYALESRGHRSSFSDGRSVEYPELEMVSPLPAPLPPPRSLPIVPAARALGVVRNHLPSREWKPVVRRSRSEDSVIPCDFTRASSVPLIGATVGTEPPGARTWSKMYQECIGGDPRGNYDSVAAVPPGKERGERRMIDRSLSHIGPTDVVDADA